MIIEELERYAGSVGVTTGHLTLNGQTYLVLREVRIPGGSHGGTSCDIGLLVASGSPWVPQAAIHVKPHLVPMGQRGSQPSPLGPEWQYLSRRYDRVPTPRDFFVHVLTVVAEL